MREGQFGSYIWWSKFTLLSLIFSLTKLTPTLKKALGWCPTEAKEQDQSVNKNRQQKILQYFYLANFMAFENEEYGMN